jgi:glycosyltransferase involved in cell wall biosynthesis
MSRVPANYLGVNGIRLVTPVSGVARYIENVLRCWSEMEHPFPEVRVYTPSPLGPKVKIPPSHRSVVVPSRAPYWFWEQCHLSKAHGERAVLFCPSYVAPLRSKAPIVLIHHGSYEAYPQAFGWWTRQKTYYAYMYSARRADRLVTVSEQSKRDMVRFYGVPASKIHVIPEGVDTSLFRPIKDESVLSAFRKELLGEDAPYILYVGKPVRRRNVSAMLEAYGRLLKAGRTTHRFVLIGCDLPGMSIAPVVKSLGLERHVTLIGHASHEKIRLAYNASTMLVYPSSYEGFGMPVIEAMACGTPVITLRNTSFLEFADGIGYLAEKGDVATLFHAMDEVLHDAPRRERMALLGVERAQAYDWKIIAKRTMGLIKELVA